MDLLAQQHTGEGSAREMTALVGVKDFRLALSKRVLQSLPDSSPTPASVTRKDAALVFSRLVAIVASIFAARFELELDRVVL